MILFLTSSPTGDLCGPYRPDGFDDRNGFLYNLRLFWKDAARCLMITAFPDNSAANAEMLQFFSNAALRSGLTFSRFELWDSSTPPATAEALNEFDVVFLGGGHVPTQNSFFSRLGLRSAFKGYHGIVIGISAGSMNCANLVYAEPEEPGEATDEHYRRFIRGLGLTTINVLPHHQLVRNSIIDGLRLFEDIIFPDSRGQMFVSIPDGSYLLCKDGITTVHGEYHIITEGTMADYYSENGEKIV